MDTDKYVREEDLEKLRSTLSTALDGVDSDTHHSVLFATKESLRDAFLPRLQVRKAFIA